MHAALCLLALLVPAAPPAPAPSPARTTAFAVLDRIQAVVGDEILLESEVDALTAIGVLKRDPAESDEAYRERVLKQRVDELLVDQQLRRTGSLAPDERIVEARMGELVARAEAAGGFDAALARARSTRAGVRDWIRRSVALEQYVRERVSPTVKVSDEEAKAFLEGPFRAEARARGLPEPAPFAEVADEMRELLRQRKLTEAITVWVAKLRDDARILVYRRQGPTDASR